MDTRVWERLEQARLTIDQTSTPLEIDRDEVERFYDPLARLLLERQQDRPGRLIVAVAGPPGVGKTAFTTLLVAVINAMTDASAIQLQQDGWHYPNAYLAAHTTRRGGAEVPLAQCKGTPESFDAAAIYACLEKIRRGETVDFPVYSRALHEPVTGAGRVEAGHRVVMIEGNYLLLQAEPWRQFLPLLDVRICLSAPREALVDGLRQRHLRGGKSSAAAEAQIQRVDLPDIDLVLDQSAPGQIVVRKADSKRILGVEYRQS
jgi:pantothenate kinase